MPLLVCVQSDPLCDCRSLIQATVSHTSCSSLGITCSSCGSLHCSANAFSSSHRRRLETYVTAVSVSAIDSCVKLQSYFGWLAACHWNTSWEKMENPHVHFNNHFSCGSGLARSVLIFYLHLFSKGSWVANI